MNHCFTFVDGYRESRYVINTICNRECCISELIRFVMIGHLHIKSHITASASDSNNANILEMLPDLSKQTTVTNRLDRKKCEKASGVRKRGTGTLSFSFISFRMQRGEHLPCCLARIHYLLSLHTY